MKHESTLEIVITVLKKEGVGTMNRSTKTIITILTAIFLIVQIILGMAFIFLIFGALAIFFSGSLKSNIAESFSYGPAANQLSLSFLTQRQFMLLILLVVFLVLIGTIFLFQYLRTLLQNLNKGEVFSDYNLKYIRRVMLIYLIGGILNFIFEILSISYTSSSTLSGTGNLVLGLFQVFMMTAGIYTLYFVFKYGIALKKDSETII